MTTIWRQLTIMNEDELDELPLNVEVVYVDNFDKLLDS